MLKLDITDKESSGYFSINQKKISQLKLDKYKNTKFKVEIKREERESIIYIGSNFFILNDI